MLIVFRCFIGFPLLYSVIGPELAPPFNQSDSKFACTNHNSVDAAFSAFGGQLGFTLRSHRPFMFCLFVFWFCLCNCFSFSFTTLGRKAFYRSVGIGYYWFSLIDTCGLSTRGGNWKLNEQKKVFEFFQIDGMRKKYNWLLEQVHFFVDWLSRRITSIL